MGKTKKESQKNESPVPNKRLTSSEEIINRLKWDATFPAEQFSITYLDRFLGMMEQSLEAFLDEGEVPFHRIYQFTLNSHVVWDRKSRTDLISNMEAVKFIEQDNLEEYERETIELRTETSQVSSNQVSEKEKKGKQQEVKLEKIIFNPKKGRKHYVQYLPEDCLENWMSNVNFRELALLKPTHISQKGGYYHIDITQRDTFFKKWMETLQKKQTLYMEEYRTDVFRLYLDLDFKTTNGKPFDMQNTPWINVICQFTQRYFENILTNKSNPVNAHCLMIESHGEWSDSTTTANYKSGYRLYFSQIFVDEETLKSYCTALGNELSKEVGFYPFCPENWKMKDIVDYEQCMHKRARLFGSTKYRRGKLLGRKYQFVGSFDKNGKMSKKMTNILTSNLLPLLQLLSVRFPGHYDGEKRIEILVISTQYQKMETYHVDLTNQHRSMLSIR